MKCAWHCCSNEVIGQRNKIYCSKRCGLKAAVTRKRRELKRRAVELLGGACSRCGYSKCVQTASLHPGPREQEMTKRLAKAIAAAKAEVAKWKPWQRSNDPHRGSKR